MEEYLEPCWHLDEISEPLTWSLRWTENASAHLSLYHSILDEILPDDFGRTCLVVTDDSDDVVATIIDNASVNDFVAGIRSQNLVYVQLKPAK